MFQLFTKNTKDNNDTLSSERKSELKKLCKKLNIRLRSLSMLDRALTHSSYIKKNNNKDKCYERLEFLGDAVLSASVAYILYEDKPNFREGRMTSLRSSIVDEPTLAEIGFELGLDKYINLGKGENLSDTRARKKVTSDVVEAIIAAIFLEKGFKEAFKFVQQIMKGHIKNRLVQGTEDNKTKLQKLVVERFKQYPMYKVIDEKGPDHSKIFNIKVTVAGKYTANGKGRSKKEAEKEAAGKVLAIILRSIKSKKQKKKVAK